MRVFTPLRVESLRERAADALSQFEPLLKILA
jgi:hypothetical protein